jgi:hypothetical protein
MRSLIRNQDLKSIFSGSAMAVAAGLMAGGLMYPELIGPGDVGGPQLQAGSSGARTAYYGGSANWAPYSGEVPDYVIGTDWRKPTEYADYNGDEEIPPEEETVVYTAAAVGETTEVTARTWEEPASEPVSFPSTAGGVPYGADLPRPPPPPAEDDSEVADLHAANPG